MQGLAQCSRCQTVCGVIDRTEAKAGRWSAVIDHACHCGAEPVELRPIAEGDARPLVPYGAVLAVVLVPDGWPFTGRDRVTEA